MTTLRQILANRRNARKSTGPVTSEGKERSRYNAVRHGLTAETVVGALEDAEDYRAFEAAVIADYNASSAVERELVLRLASLLWRLRRAIAIETGLFEIEANDLVALGSDSRELAHPSIGRPTPPSWQQSSTSSVRFRADASVTLSRCFSRVANQRSFAFDRLNRYEVTLWRQVGRILFALEGLDRRKPQERRSSIYLSSGNEPPD
jgi:hypothetical protein